MGRVAGVTPEQTRKRVIDGAAAVFAEQGFERARVADIARAAGLSNGAMYNHFASKADLLAAVVACYAGDQLASVLQSGDARGLLGLVEARGRQLGERVSILAPLLIETVSAARRDPEVQRVLSDQVAQREDLSTSLITMAQQAGEVSADADPRALARFCLMLALGSLVLQTMDLPDLDPDGWGSIISRLIETFRAQEGL